MSRLKDMYKNEIVDAMIKKFGYKNIMEVPKLDKIVINMGVGEAKDNAKVLESAVADMEKITGQKAVLTKAKNSVANGRHMCESVLSESDDEIALLMAECALEIAKEEFLAGNLHNACHWFDTALRDADQTTYYTGHITAPAIVYFRYMRSISVSLTSYEAENLLPGERDFSAWQETFCRYALIMEQLENLAPLHHFDGDSPLERHLTMHIEATERKAAGDFAGAYAILQSILADEDAPIPVLLYRVLHDMETCCKALDDYKGAYDHALHKLSVQEKLLAESTV